jgi:hypothetical protein
VDTRSRWPRRCRRHDRGGQYVTARCPKPRHAGQRHPGTGWPVLPKHAGPRRRRCPPGRGQRVAGHPRMSADTLTNPASRGAASLSCPTWPRESHRLPAIPASFCPPRRGQRRHRCPSGRGQPFRDVRGHTGQPGSPRSRTAVLSASPRRSPHRRPSCRRVLSKPPTPTAGVSIHRSCSASVATPRMSVDTLTGRTEHGSAPLFCPPRRAGHSRFPAVPDEFCPVPQCQRQRFLSTGRGPALRWPLRAVRGHGVRPWPAGWHRCFCPWRR